MTAPAAEPYPPALLRAVEIMDQLRSPGGCAWDAAQTHESLARYLLEETYETLEAIESGDAGHLREELGDLLLQVLFHARLAEELPPEQRFSIDDVAADLVDKLVRRHPHVFSDASAPTAGQVDKTWDELKAREKKRVSLTEGVPPAQPALAYSAALVTRVERAGLPVDLGNDAQIADAAADEMGRQLFALVRQAVAAGVDPETALRRVARDYRDAILAVEAGSKS